MQISGRHSKCCGYSGKGETATFFPRQQGCALEKAIADLARPRVVRVPGWGWGSGERSGGSKACGLAAEEYTCHQDRAPMNPESHCSDPVYSTVGAAAREAGCEHLARTLHRYPLCRRCWLPITDPVDLQVLIRCALAAETFSMILFKL